MWIRGKQGEEREPKTNAFSSVSYVSTWQDKQMGLCDAITFLQMLQKTEEKYSGIRKRKKPLFHLL